ncbi:DUF7689 domain-containing protein [Nostoc sp.]|uniref:DUF7689 domain-containing protein n=1 Tax=Nostoc sp. TaxID=1180 RepID=UPI002FFB6BDC
MLGYEVCQSDVLEEGFQKIAIYTDSNKVPTHIARQLPTGKWTSKLGSLEDIEHNNLQGLTGNPAYGELTYIIKNQFQSRKDLAQSNYQANLKSDRLTMTN